MDTLNDASSALLLDGTGDDVLGPFERLISCVAFIDRFNRVVVETGCEEFALKSMFGDSFRFSAVTMSGFL